jgi:hypothetical protein
MSNKKAALSFTLIFSFVLLAGGCTQMPTEKQTISDMRPQISFKAQSESSQNARVLVDGLDLGSVGDFLDGVAAVRVLPGMHKLTVTTGMGVLLDEKVYLGDGVSRSYIVK